ncbi:MAG: hypothetical protein GWP18_05525 [Proteobacteria bacterium]|nr:hypothetical protein [Pseudomonadota bacterium]
MKGAPTLSGLQMPIDWTIFGWPDVPRLGGVTCTTGDPMWAWEQGAPAFGINVFDPPPGIDVDSFRIDHVVLLVPELPEAIATLGRAGADVRLAMEVNGRPAAFFRVGPVLEVIESPVREAAIYGVALTTHLSLETLALEWRGRGLSVGDPKDAIQPGRRIMTIHDLDAGCAVMSNDRAIDH